MRRNAADDPSSLKLERATCEASAAKPPLSSSIFDTDGWLATVEGLAN